MYQFPIETSKEIIFRYLNEVNNTAEQIMKDVRNIDFYIAYDKAMNLLVSSLYEYNLKAPVTLQYKAIGDKEIGSSSDWWGDNLWAVALICSYMCLVVCVVSFIFHSSGWGVIYILKRDLLCVNLVSSSFSLTQAFFNTESKGWLNCRHPDTNNACIR